MAWRVANRWWFLLPHIALSPVRPDWRAEKHPPAVDVAGFDRRGLKIFVRGTVFHQERPFVARVKNLKNAEEAENDSCNPPESNVLAQKKPLAVANDLADTNGFRVDEGIRTPDFWNHNPEAEDPNLLPDKPLTETANPSGTTKGTKPIEPAALMASDAALADLVENASNDLESILTPDTHLVVKHWPNLPEDAQRAILAIVRMAGGQSEVKTERKRPK